MEDDWRCWVPCKFLIYDVDIINVMYSDRNAKARCLVMTCVWNSNGLPNNRNCFICPFAEYSAYYTIHIWAGASEDVFRRDLLLLLTGRSEKCGKPGWLKWAETSASTHSIGQKTSNINITWYQMRFPTNTLPPSMEQHLMKINGYKHKFTYYGISYVGSYLGKVFGAIHHIGLSAYVRTFGTYTTIYTILLPNIHTPIRRRYKS